MNIRAVYIPIGVEVINNTPVLFIEFKEFWNTHIVDDGFVMIYIDENNNIVN